MRQKKIKAATLPNLASLGVITEPKLIEANNDVIELEIGSGKGQFITTLASCHPDTFYVALEKDLNVAYRLALKQDELKLDNLVIICADAVNLKDYFNSNTISKIYLNFSDPWPKTRHHKRRLTYDSFLEIYQSILKPDATLQFRTDVASFFYDSLEYFTNRFKTIKCDLNLAASNYMTEYEIKKRTKGPIFQYQGVVKK